MVIILDRELRKQIEREVERQMKPYWDKLWKEVQKVLMPLPQNHEQETKLVLTPVLSNSSPAEIYECDEGEDEGLRRIREHEDCTDLTAEEEEYLLEEGRERDYEEKENGI